MSTSTLTPSCTQQRPGSASHFDDVKRRMEQIEREGRVLERPTGYGCRSWEFRWPLTGETVSFTVYRMGDAALFHWWTFPDGDRRRVLVEGRDVWTETKDGTILRNIDNRFASATMEIVANAVSGREAA